MKKTNEELLQFYGLKVGDKVKVDGYYYPFVIVEENGKIFAKRENSLSSWDYYDIGKLTNVLLKNEYEVVKPKKKIGERKCEEFVNCKGCPFALSNVCITSRTVNGNKNFIEIVKSTQKELDDIKLRLDEEVEELK